MKLNDENENKMADLYKAEALAARALVATFPSPCAIPPNMVLAMTAYCAARNKTDENIKKE